MMVRGRTSSARSSRLGSKRPRETGRFILLIIYLICLFDHSFVQLQEDDARFMHPYRAQICQYDCLVF
jgi:hypothetical protein